MTDSNLSFRPWIASETTSVCSSAVSSVTAGVSSAASSVVPVASSVVSSTVSSSGANSAARKEDELSASVSASASASSSVDSTGGPMYLPSSSYRSLTFGGMYSPLGMSSPTFHWVGMNGSTSLQSGHRILANGRNR